MENNNNNNQVRINVYKNGGNAKEMKIIIIQRDNFDEFLKISSNKLRIKAKRIFNQYGEEINEDDLKNINKIPDDTILAVSTGNDFLGNI